MLFLKYIDTRVNTLMEIYGIWKQDVEFKYIEEIFDIVMNEEIVKEK